MRARVDLDPESRGALELDGVLALVSTFAVTPLGAARVRGLVPLADERAIDREQLLVEEAGLHLVREGRLVPGGLPDPSQALAGLAVEGARLPAAAVRDLALVLIAASDLREKLAGLDAAGYPALRAAAAGLPDLRSDARPVARNVLPDGRIADEASAELQRIRGSIARVGERLRRMLEALLHEPSAASVIQDDFVTQRNGRFVIPVRSDSPRRVPGIVHASSSSGATYFVEPMETIELNNELVQLAEQEIEEQERIVAGWTERFRARRAEVELAVAAVAETDSLQARALFATDAQACRPSVRAGGELALVEVRHPLLDRRLREAGTRAVPITLELGPREHVLVLSGPNAGGKTVALKTLGLASLMAQAGIPVAAARAQLPLFGQVRADIGDHQSIEADLSTFSAHVQAVARFVREARAPSLFLFDEIGTGTDPAEGAALSRAILEHLNREGSTTVATTHQGSLKSWAFTTAGAVSAALEFDAEKLRPTYRILMGAAGVSAGIEIGARLGLDPEIVARAREQLGPGSREVEASMARLRELTGEAERRLRELGEREVELARERERLESRSRAEIEKRRREAGEALERAVRELREEGRKELSTVRDKRERALLEREQAGVARRLAAEAERRKGEIEAIVAGEQVETGPLEKVEPGTRVFVRSLGKEGEVVALRGERVDVRLGQAVFSVGRSDLRAASRIVRAAPRPPVVKAPTGSRPVDDLGSAPREILLLGKTVEEGLADLDKFLDDAALAGWTEVRVIHGHGTGRLRSAVRRFLSGHTHVESQRPGGEHEGGDGATLARLR